MMYRFVVECNDEVLCIKDFKTKEELDEFTKNINFTAYRVNTALDYDILETGVIQ